MAMTKAELLIEYDKVRQERDALLKAQAEFVEDVLAVATYGATEHDLCYELEASLKMLGLEPHAQTITIERVISETYTFPGFDAQRSGLTDPDPEQRARAFREASEWGFGYDNNKTLSDYTRTSKDESVRVLIEA